MLSRQYSALKSRNDEDQEEIFCSEDSTDDVPDLLHCITCGKNFKNMKQLVNHENSRKHRENLAQIESQLTATHIDSDSEKIDQEENYQTQERVRIEDGMNLSENPLFGGGMVTSISSVSLPDEDTLKTLETLETGLENDSELDDEFYIEQPNFEGGNGANQTTFDSLLYMKIKELKNRRCTLPVKETLERLVKNPSYSQFDEDAAGCTDDCDNLIPNDSNFILPRAKKFPSMEESFESKGMKRSVTEGNIRAGMVKHAITDSLKILKKRTVAEGGKFRKRFLSRSAPPVNGTFSETR